MKPYYRHPDPAFIVETLVETLLADGTDLRAVTLVEFKEGLKQTIRWMVEEFNETSIWPHRCTTSSQMMAV